mmetsp:Transcript_126278/g.404222  ORF Transcript_126278/g.404222 Transcript_126278/m.404222 type:complete len:271 (-) Transcript_126278:254-1066(-)
MSRLGLWAARPAAASAARRHSAAVLPAARPAAVWCCRWQCSLFVQRLRWMCRTIAIHSTGFCVHRWLRRSPHHVGRGGCGLGDIQGSRALESGRRSTASANGSTCSHPAGCNRPCAGDDLRTSQRCRWHHSGCGARGSSGGDGCGGGGRPCGRQGGGELFGRGFAVGGLRRELRRGRGHGGRGQTRQRRGQRPRRRPRCSTSERRLRSGQRAGGICAGACCCGGCLCGGCCFDGAVGRPDAGAHSACLELVGGHARAPPAPRPRRGRAAR